MCSDMVFDEILKVYFPFFVSGTVDGSPGPIMLPSGVVNSNFTDGPLSVQVSLLGACMYNE